MMNVSYKAIGVNTKVRRLAFGSALVQLVGRREMNEDQVCNLLMDWGQKHAELLKDYYNKQGAVTSYKSSAIRYVQFAQEADLLNKIMGSYRVSRMGLLLSALISEDKTNPFFLSDVEQIFYTLHLLSMDADLLLTVFDLVQKSEGASLKEMQQSFKDAYITRLTHKLNTANNEPVKQLLLERRTITQNEWRKPERYAEHIVPPRLGWLLDLGMLDPTAFQKGAYQLSVIGRRFAALLPINLQSNGYSDITDQWLKEKFFSQVCPLFLTQIQPAYWKNVADTKLRAKIGTYLNAAFQNFRMIGVPAIPLEETVLYICIKLVIDGQILMDQTDFLNWLSNAGEIDGKRYEIRKLARISESYIILVGEYEGSL